jgi:hypothetical protein
VAEAVPLLPPIQVGLLEELVDEILFMVKLNDAGGAVLLQISATEPAVFTKLSVNVPLVVSGGLTVAV